MFKFGKNTKLNGPYAKYRTPLSEVRGSVREKIRVSKGSAVEADCAPQSGGTGGFGDPNSTGGSGQMGMNSQGGMNPFGGAGGAGGGGNGYNTDRFNPVYDFLEEGTVLESWIPRDASGLDLLFRRIYLRDPTLGPGIDIISGLPWSEFTLDGVKDKAIRDIYEDCMSYLHVQLLMPDMTKDFLTVGKDASSLIFDDRKGVFSGIVGHDADFLRITPLPVYGFDPLVDLKISPGFRRFLTSQDPRALDAKRALSPEFLEAASREMGFLPLDPVSTIYLARKAAKNDHIGTSILTRCLYFWAIEKALLNAQMTSTRRRARPFMHVMAGIDNIWEPTADDLDALAAMLMQVNEDPVGGALVTRTGVTISEPVGGGADFYKWSDELELFAKYKMQALGISDALINGDATYNNAEQARSVFVENLANLRARITNGVFYRKVFPTIARLHNFVKQPKSNIHNGIKVMPGAIKPGLLQSNFGSPSWARPNALTNQRLTQRNAMAVPVSDLIMPTINWAKQLRPTQDEKGLEILEKLQTNEYPVTLKQWASAAGLDSKTIESDTKEDKDLRKKLQALDEEQNASENADETEGGGTGGPENSADAEPGNENDAADKLIDQLEKGGGEAASSSYHKAKRIESGYVNRISELPIWVGGRCGKLARTEAIGCLKELIVKYPKAIFGDAKQLQGVLNQKLGSDKAQVMGYILGRMNYSVRIPITSQTASIIAEAAAKKLSRHAKFNSEKALLDLKRYEMEVKVLGAFTGNKAFKEDLRKTLSDFKQEALSTDRSSFSGVMD